MRNIDWLKGKGKYGGIFMTIQRLIPFPIKRFINWLLIKFYNKKTDINTTCFFMLLDILSRKITIGYNSYIGPNSYFFCGNDFISIGKYCAIAGNFFAITYNHSTEYITSNINQYKNKINLNQEVKHGSIVIGNDVWIGWNETVLPGITILKWGYSWCMSGGD